MTLLLLLGCAPDPVVDTGGFEVVGVNPKDGEDDVVEAFVPELRFSLPVDPETCGPVTVRLDGIEADHTVSFEVALTLLSVDGGSKLQFDHERPLPRGWQYAVTVRGGDAGCTSVSGLPVVPWHSTFTVP